MITLAAAWAAQDMLFTNPTPRARRPAVRFSAAKLFGLDISGWDQPARYAAFTFIVFVLAAVVVANIRRGRLGRRMIAVRSNERAAAASGVGVFRTKLVAFAISGALAGLAGVLFSFQFQAPTFAGFDPFTSLLTVAQSVIGGVGFIFGTVNPGAVIAPGALTSLIGLKWAGFHTGFRSSAASALLAVLFNQDGITSTNVRDLHKLEAKLADFAPGRRRRSEFDVATEATAPTRVTPKRLQIEDLTVRYGGVVAVDSISSR